LAQDGEEAIKLANPISADLSVMRTSLWAGLMQALTHNLNRQQDRVRLFEVGRNFLGTQDSVEQHRQIAGVVYGSRYAEQWAEKQRQVDFFDVKADIEALLNLGRNSDIRFVAESHPALHPGQSARIYKGDTAIGWLGALHPKLNKPLDVKGRVYLFEIVLSNVLEANVPKFESISRFPANRRDLALRVSNNISLGEIQRCLQGVRSDILKGIQLFDVYSGDGVEQGYKSIAMAFHLQHVERTLTDDEVEALMKIVTERLEQELGITVRS
jgi:phenylalanyl-tRNA synthetase beta chain